jgi:electron transfer flavoprotein beta subunit
MGAAKAVHLVQDVPFRDSLTVAKMLTAELEASKPDVILFGRQAVDNDNAQVGLMVATLLGIPAVPDITKLSIEGTTATVEREAEGGSRDVYKVELPAVFTAQKGLNQPRYPNLKGIMAAKKKPIDTKEPAAVAASQEVVALELPPERGGGKIVGQGAEAVPELLRLLREESGVL